MTDAENLYAVVLFLPKKNGDNLIDLVPSVWIDKKRSNNIPQCQYPDVKDYGKLPQWVAQLKQPEKDWKYFQVEIIAYAHNMKQGRRRLNRALTTTNVRSTEEESEPQREIQHLPTLLSESDILEELDNISSQFPTMQFNRVQNGSQTPHFQNEIQTERDSGEKEDSTHKKRNITHGFSEERLEEKLQEILTTLNSVKRSLLYDFDKKINDLKNTIITNSVKHVPSGDIVQIKERLETSLPIKSIQDFLHFEEAITDCQEKKEALIHLYRLLICGETYLKTSIKKIMTATISKEVEIEYTAFGRQVNGVGKRDFSRTHTFSCMKDALVEKGGTSDELKNLSTIFSRWFSGAADRNGGRKQRDTVAKDIPKTS